MVDTVQHSVAFLKQAVERDSRIIEALVAYSKGEELKLGGLKFATGDQRRLLESDAGRAEVKAWARFYADSIFAFRSILASDEFFIDWSVLHSMSTDLLETASEAVEGAKSAQKQRRSRFFDSQIVRGFLTSEQEQHVRRRLEILQRMVADLPPNQ